MNEHEINPRSPEQDMLYEITRVERHLKKAGMYDIYVDGQLACTVHEDTLVAMRLLKGMKLDDADLARMEREERIAQAMDQAVRWLARRPHASREIEQRLGQAGWDDEIAADVVAKLRERRLLDDRAFAEQWTEYRLRSQRKGRHLIRYELMQKGVDKSDIEAAVRAIDHSEELDTALQIAMKKWRQTSGDDAARRQKTAAFLLRRGFPGEIVRSVLDECAAWEADGEQS